MRIAEKTLEINFCSQLTSALGVNIIWFGLTQAQEARWGFDECARLGGTLLILQFKASDRVAAGGRRFRLAHPQMQALRSQVKPGRAIYYVLPDLGTTAELSKNPRILGQSWLLDVAQLPNPTPPPIKRSGVLRRSGLHYLHLRPPTATMSSDPLTVRVVNGAEFSQELLIKMPIPRGTTSDVRDFQALKRALSRNAVGAIILR